jgi:hypothetical protein
LRYEKTEEAREERVRESAKKEKRVRLTMDALRAVIGPAFSSIEGIKMLDVAFEALFRVFCAVLLKA